MTHICPICGYEGRPRRTKRGSAKMEWALYLTILVPGPFYSLYRRIGLPLTCPNCKADRMVRLNSDEGQVAQKMLDARLGLLPVKKSTETLATSAKIEDTFVQPPVERVKRDIDPDVW
jgi:hypothetical protein